MMHAAGLDGMGDGSPVQLIALCFSVGSFLIVTLGGLVIHLAWGQVRDNRDDLKELKKKYENVLELLNDVDKRKLSIPSGPYRRPARSRPGDR